MPGPADAMGEMGGMPPSPMAGQGGMADPSALLAALATAKTKGKGKSKHRKGGKRKARRK